MADFTPAFKFLLPHEGGYTHDPNDPGGETKYGLSKRAYPQLDIAALTVDDAQRIYARDYWFPYPYSQIQVQEIASKIFDLTVNMGAHQSHTLAQRACNRFGCALVEDGKLGAISIHAINDIDPTQLLYAIREEARAYYLELVKKRPSSSKFLKGWLARAYA